ncbi:ABC transporter ATP-binding protein [Pantoea agglomerans]|uniref:ABC transporter ATP-binding protein n=1 Tax=Enterobacter agglomerans TaxID=549 RepID=UPI0037CAE177
MKTTCPSLWQSLLSPVTRHRRSLLTTLSVGILAQCGGFTCMVLAGWICMQVLTGASPQTVMSYAGLLLLSVIITALARWALAWLSHDLAFALIETLQLDIFDGLARGTPAYTGDKRLGDVAATATHDAELMERFYAHMLVDYLTAFLMPCIALLMLLLLSPLLSLIFLPCALLLMAAPLLTSHRAKRQGKTVLNAKQGLNNQIIELVQGWRDIQMFGAESRYSAKLHHLNQQLNQAQLKYGMRDGMEQALLDGLMALTLITLLGASIFMVDRATLSPVMLPFIISIIAAALVPVLDALKLGGQWGALKASAERIFNLKQLPDSVADITSSDVPTGHRLCIDGVSFSYPHSTTKVLDGLSLIIEPGERVAITGESGCGKTTLGHLLLRFYQPQSGTIALGDNDYSALSLYTLRQQVAWVSQQSWLFNDTIENNIRLGRPEATFEQVKHAAQLAQAADFIGDLPLGYQTVCTNGGDKFSGGQRQRIALARALISSAPVIVMDETSAGLDNENEEKILDALKNLPGSRTIIMIAHRISMLKNADQILLLEHGKITESGDHSSLIARQGSYAKLVETLDAHDEWGMR